tara:strand:+ start:136 stop:552 length:417 start_codon:yes stop_codon:yes gene_type:complete
LFSSLAQPSTTPYRRRERPRKRTSKNLTTQPKRIDAATIASNLQLQEEKRDLTYSLISLLMKSGFLFICIASLIKLGVSSNQRIARYSELSNVVDLEMAKMINLQRRFDRFFTLDGEKRLIAEQVQWIAPNRVRVIWK